MCTGFSFVPRGGFFILREHINWSDGARVRQIETDYFNMGEIKAEVIRSFELFVQ